MNPLDHISQLFQSQLQHVSSAAAPSQALEGLNDKQAFDSYLSNQDFMNSIPYLRKSLLGRVGNHSLVTYRGLVQDILDMEYYCALYEEYNKQTNDRKLILSKYKDTIVAHNGGDNDVVIDLDGPNSVIAERLALFCVPIPGETNWANRYFNSQHTSTDTTMVNGVMSEQNTVYNRKRQSNDDALLAPSTSSNSKRQVISSNSGDTVSATHEDGAMQPSRNKFVYEGTHDSDEMCCMVKMYNSNSADSIKLNDMIEIVGILSLDVAIEDGDAANELGQHRVDSPAATVGPRVHCITYRKLCSSFPLLKQISATGGMPLQCQYPVANLRRDESVFLTNVNSDYTSLMGSARSIEIRQAILNRLTKALDGDKLSAEYVLLVLLSKVYSRSDGVMLGALTLNLYGDNVNDKITASLYEVTSLLMARCVHLSASTASFNNSNWMPERDEESSRILPSPIQVGVGTVLLITETAINQVELNKNGVKSMQALQSMVLLQKLPVQFSYYQVQIPTEASFIFVSREESSIINSDSDIVRVHLECSEVADMDIAEDSVSIDDIRLWLVAIRELSERPLDEDMLQFIEEDFVRSRQLNRDITPSTFHNWLTLARLIAFSNGSNIISRVEWDYMRRLENDREKRINNIMSE